MAELCWATVTVGKPHKIYASSFGSYSVRERAYRWNMVRTALEFQSGQAPKFSTLFDAMDPTEKGGISFYLGMTFTKLCAAKLLNVPWLIHFHWMKQNYPLTIVSGRSSPDLLGFEPTTGDWHVFEAKGRSGAFDQKALDKAKHQASRMVSVDGNWCSLRIGAQAYRKKRSKSLRFHWDDPPESEDPPIELETNRETWLEYYGPLRELELACEENPRAFLNMTGFLVKLAPEARNFADALLNNERGFEDEQQRLQFWSLERDAEIWNGDGTAFIVEDS